MKIIENEEHQEIIKNRKIQRMKNIMKIIENEENQEHEENHRK